MAAAAILKIGFSGHISIAMAHICTRFYTGTKNIPTSHFAVKIQFPQNPRWRRPPFWNSL